MPRGIPKDPNHPRNNKKKNDTAGAAPKRRGRPPGSKNAAKQAAAVTTVTQKPAQIAKAAPAAVVDHSFQTQIANLEIVRANIAILSSCGGPAAAQAMNSQIEQLIQLTEVLTSNEQGSSTPIAATTFVPQVVASLPAPPSFAPPPFPPHMPGQS